MTKYERQTEILLRKFGVNSSYTGFKYVSFGVELIIKDPLILTHVCKGFYTEIAIKYHTTPYCVEQNIRTIKELIWKKNGYVLQNIFGDLITYPSNAEFMDSLAVYISDYVNTCSE